MLNRLKYKLKESGSKSDVNQDAFTQVSFTGERTLLPVGEINHIVDVGAEFNRERNESTIYRIKGTICPLFSNPLMNQTRLSTSANGNTTPVTTVGNGLDIFNGYLFIEDQTSSTISTKTTGEETLSYKESYDLYLDEKEGWFGFTDPDIRKAAFCEYIDIEPTRARFDLNSAVAKNWELTMTYPYSSDATHHIVNGGLLIVSSEEVVVGGKPMIALGTSTQHGLENGNRVRLTNMSNSTNNGDFTVKRLGLDNGDYLDNYFVIDIDPSVTSVGVISARMKKLVGTEESVYYLRKFKKIITDNDYEIYPLGFSKTIFNDTNYQFLINEDIDIDGLRDNLGRPLSELYATFIKADSGVFGKVKSGLDLELIPGNRGDINLSNVRQMHTAASTASVPNHIPLPGEGDIYTNFANKSWFYGDVVEYNRFTLKETVLSKVLHTFNTTIRENGNSNTLAKGPRNEGYMYNPHHLFKIREFSLYIEQGDESTGGIPDYAEYLGPNDGRYLWRDFLDIGVYDGDGDFLDYPFTNGAHYLHQNICFMTTRQDPYNHYGLYYKGNEAGGSGVPSLATDTFDPSDPIGDAITDNFTVKKGQDVC